MMSWVTHPIAERRTCAPTATARDLMPRTGGLLPGEDLRVILPFRVQEAHKASLQAAEGVVDQQIPAGNIDLKLDHHGASWGDAHRLDVGKRLGGERGKGIDPVEDLTDHMEGRCEVGPAHPEEDPHGLSHLGAQSLLVAGPCACKSLRSWRGTVRPASATLS